MSYKTIVAEYGIKPWEMERLTVADLQTMRLAQQAEAYLKYEARQEAQSGSQHNNKAKMRNTTGARDFRKKAKAGEL